jgi:uncharacterized protein (UPF0335 family)
MDLKFTTAGDYMMSDTASVTADELRAFIERIETLEEEKTGVSDQIKDVMSEAKGRGYEAKIIRKIVSIRKRNRDDVDNENAMTELYMDALGM